MLNLQSAKLLKWIDLCVSASLVLHRWKKKSPFGEILHLKLIEREFGCLVSVSISLHHFNIRTKCFLFTIYICTTEMRTMLKLVPSSGTCLIVFSECFNDKRKIHTNTQTNFTIWPEIRTFRPNWMAYSTRDTIKHDTANDALQHFSTLTLKRSLACDFGPRKPNYPTRKHHFENTRLGVGNCGTEAVRNDFTTVGNCADHVAKHFELYEKWILWMKWKRQRIFIQSARLSQFRVFRWCRLSGFDVD